MRAWLRKLGLGKFVYEHVFLQWRRLEMLWRDTDGDARRLELWHIAKSRARRLRGTLAGELHSDFWGTCELIELAREKLPPDAPVWDVGAHTGTWAVLARSLMPRAPIVSVEPLPDHVAQIRKLESALSPFTLVEAAVGARAGELTIHRTSRSDSSSALPPSETMRRAYGVEESAQVVVPMVTLGDLFETTGRAPGLLKLDVQGFELEVLRGGEGMLGEVRFIIAELSFVELYEGQPLAAEVMGWLHERGFEPVALGAETETAMRLAQADVLFENRRWAGGS